MIVRELIALLAGMNQSLEVKAEGCDCINPVKGAVALEEESWRGGGHYLLLETDLHHD